MLPAYSRRCWLTAKFYFIHCLVAQDGFYCGEHMLGSATDTVVNGFLTAATVTSVKVQLKYNIHPFRFPRTLTFRTLRLPST